MDSPQFDTKLQDFCPTYVPTGEFVINASNSDCRNIFNLPDTDAFESFDSSSRCIQSSISSTNINATILDSYKAICYPIICTVDIATGLTTYLINLGNLSIPCGTGNATIIAPEGVYGNVSCPPVQEVCPIVAQQCPAMCSGHGSCLGSQAPQTCVCKPGWTGIQCDIPSWNFSTIQYPPVLIAPILASPVPGLTIDLTPPTPSVTTAIMTTTSGSLSHKSALSPATLASTWTSHATIQAATLSLPAFATVAIETASLISSAPSTAPHLPISHVTSMPHARNPAPGVGNGIVFTSPNGEAILNGTSPSSSPKTAINSQVYTVTGIDATVGVTTTLGSTVGGTTIAPATITSSSRGPIARLRHRHLY